MSRKWHARNGSSAACQHHIRPLAAFGIADGQIGAFGKSLFSGAAIRDVIRDKWPAIRHEEDRRHSPVQHIPLLGLLVYFLP